jgi:hypothetical protein
VWKKRCLLLKGTARRSRRSGGTSTFISCSRLYRFRAISPLAGNEVLNDPPGDRMQRDNLTLAENRCPLACGFRVVMQRHSGELIS